MMRETGLVTHEDGKARCPWCGTLPEYMAYHDDEWGVPERDSRALFEKLILDGFQAGLAWITILRKRDGFRSRFDGFEPRKLTGWGEADIAGALADPGIVRHRGKIEAAIHNARMAIELAAQEGSLAAFFWRHEPDPASRVPGQVVRHFAGRAPAVLQCPGHVRTGHGTWPATAARAARPTARSGWCHRPAPPAAHRPGAGH